MPSDPIVPRPHHGSEAPGLRALAERAVAAGGVVKAAPTPRPARASEDTGFVEVSALRAMLLSGQRPAPWPGAVGTPVAPERERDEEATTLYVPPREALAYARSTAPAGAKPARRRSLEAAAAAVAVVALGLGAWAARSALRSPPAGAAAREISTVSVGDANPLPAVDQPKAGGPESGQAGPPAPAALPTPVADEPREGMVSLASLPDTKDPSEPTGARGANEPREAPAARPAGRDAKPAEAKDAGRAPARGADKPPRDLKSAMAAAVGDAPARPAEPAAPAPAPAPPPAGDDRSQPTQAEVRAALKQVRAAAHGCLDGTDEPTRAAITFAANGSVKQVGLSGGGAKGSVAACLKSALAGARVAPFSGPPFTASLTLHP